MQAYVAFIKQIFQKGVCQWFEFDGTQCKTVSLLYAVNIYSNSNSSLGYRKLGHCGCAVTDNKHRMIETVIFVPELYNSLLKLTSKGRRTFQV
jgi:hypothetical protein